MLIGYDESLFDIYTFIITFIVMGIILVLIGLAIIKYSRKISTKIIRDEEMNENDKTLLKSYDALLISIILLSLYFLVTGFSYFATSLIQLIFMFLDDFSTFKEVYKTEFWEIIQYVIILLIFFNSRKFADWLYRTFFRPITGHNNG